MDDFERAATPETDLVAPAVDGQIPLLLDEPEQQDADLATSLSQL